MSYTLIFWLYVINFTLIVVHEIDSASWHEWKMFNMHEGRNLFILLHLPIIPIFIFGAIPVYNGTGLGIIFTTLVSLIGIAAFIIHMYFFARGREEFKTPVSIGLLIAIFLVSVLQLILVATTVKVS
jgi:hypothetical protein